MAEGEVGEARAVVTSKEGVLVGGKEKPSVGRKVVEEVTITEEREKRRANGEVMFGAKVAWLLQDNVTDAERKGIAGMFALHALKEKFQHASKTVSSRGRRRSPKEKRMLEITEGRHPGNLQWLRARWA
jgi:hypothetical protein